MPDLADNINYQVAAIPTTNTLTKNATEVCGNNQLELSRTIARDAIYERSIYVAVNLCQIFRKKLRIDPPQNPLQLP